MEPYGALCEPIQSYGVLWSPMEPYGATPRVTDTGCINPFRRAAAWKGPVRSWFGQDTWESPPKSPPAEEIPQDVLQRLVV